MNVVRVVVLKLVGSSAGGCSTVGLAGGGGCSTLGSAGAVASWPRIFSASAVSQHPTLTRSANAHGIAKHACPAPHGCSANLPSCASPQTANEPSMQAGSPLTVQADSAVRLPNSVFFWRAKARFVSKTAGATVVVAVGVAVWKTGGSS